jgi:ubiquinone/menaquinone biosynthesis C-methylase UbiE
MSDGSNPALAYYRFFGPAIIAPMSRITLWAAKVQQGERVLDLACGTGNLTSQLPALVGTTGKVVGLDVNPAMLAVAQTQSPTDGATIEWVRADCMATGLPDASFDLVLCQQSLQLLSDRAVGAQEIRRLLAPGGRAVISCWKGLDHQSFYSTLLRSVARHLNVTINEVAEPFTLGDSDVLRDLLETAGFSKVEIQSHPIDARFPQPDPQARISPSTSSAVMPEVYEGVDVETLIAKVLVDCKPDFDRYREGNVLRFTMPTHVAVAHV